MCKAPVRPCAEGLISKTQMPAAATVIPFLVTSRPGLVGRRKEPRTHSGILIVNPPCDWYCAKYLEVSWQLICADK